MVLMKIPALLITYLEFSDVAYAATVNSDSMATTWPN